MYSLRGCFIDGFSLDPHGFDLDSGLILRLDPLFQIALHVARQAFADAITRDLDRSRIGVVLGNLALPTETASALAREILGRTFEEQVVTDAPLSVVTEPLNRYVTGLPAGVVAGIGLAAVAGRWTRPVPRRCTPSSSRSMSCVPAGPTPCSPAASRDRTACTRRWASVSCTPCRRRAGPRLLPPPRTAWWSARAPACSCSNGCRTCCATAIVSTPSSPASACPTTCRASSSRPARKGNCGRCGLPTSRPARTPHDIDLVECHATGTPVGDAVEFPSLGKHFGANNGWRPGQCVIGSVKSNVGHTLTAAGSAGLLKVLRRRKPDAAADGQLRPTGPRAGLHRQSVPRAAQAESWRRQRPRRAAISAFGFGGINAHVLIEESVPDARVSTPVTSSSPPSSSGVPIAVVGMGAHFGPWDSLQAFQERVLGGGQDASTTQPRHWWGVERARAFGRWNEGRALSRLLS